MTFLDRLGALRAADSLEAERAFQELRAEAPDHEAALLDQLEIETHAQGRRYLLALLSESTTDTALRTLRGYIHDPDLGARSWARYGVERITGRPIEIDTRDLEEVEARLVLYPDRWRVYLFHGLQTFILYGLAMTVVNLLSLAVGWVPMSELAFRIISVWPTALVLGAIGMVSVGESYRARHRILVNDHTIAGPGRNGQPVQIPPAGVRVAEYDGKSGWKKALHMWTLQGQSEVRIEIPLRLYRPDALDRLRRVFPSAR